MKVAGIPSIKKLQIQSSSGVPTVVWPAPSTGFQLETSPDLNSWTPVPDSPTVSNGVNQVVLDPTNSAAFFRLDKPVP
jgi:hypothetical protein